MRACACNLHTLASIKRHNRASGCADTIRSKIANVGLFKNRPDLLMYGFLAVMIAAAFWDNLSALHAMCLAPAVLGTHTCSVQLPAAGPKVALSPTHANEGLTLLLAVWLAVAGRSCGSAQQVQLPSS